MLLAVHSLLFSGIFYPRAQSRGFGCEREQTGAECCTGGPGGREEVVEIIGWDKTNHLIIPFPSFAAIVFPASVFLL